MQPGLQRAVDEQHIAQEQSDGAVSGNRARWPHIEGNFLFHTATDEVKI